MNEKTKKVAYLVKPKNFEIFEESMSDSLPDSYVRVKMSHCGICGTDLSFFHGHRDEGYPVCLGHEHCGIVIDKGNNTDTIDVGNFVAIDPNFRCGECKYCLKGLGNLCDEFSKQLYSNRGFATHVDVNKAHVVVLPNDIPQYLGSLVEPLSVGLNAVSLIAPLLNEEVSICVLGAGSMGMMIILSLLWKLKYKSKIFVHDLIKEKEKKMEIVFSGKIDTNIDFKKDKFDLVFEATGNEDGFYKACNLLDKGGELVIISRYHEDQPKIPERFAWKAPIIKFTHLNGNAINMSHAVTLLYEMWKSDYEELIKLYKFSNLQAAFDEYDYNPAVKKIIEFE